MSTGPSRIVLVCSGNLIRSPLAAGLLRARLAERGVDAEVQSAGLLTQGESPSDSACAVARDLGVDVTGHVSQLLSTELVAHADLVVGMERSHVRAVVAVAPALWSRCFTLRELDRLAASHGPRPSHFSLAQWVERLGVGRSAVEVAAPEPADDLLDPVGTDLATHRLVAGQIDEAIARLVRALWPGTSAV